MDRPFSRIPMNTPTALAHEPGTFGWIG